MVEPLIIAPQGNKRELPPDVPAGVWLNELREVVEIPGLADIPWTHPVMECLSPMELMRFRAQALVWRQHTGDWPREVAWWWPVRMARRRGDVPHLNQVVEANIDEDGTLRCGFCGASWSAAHDGSPHKDRCKLCDRRLRVVNDERE